MIFRLIFVSIYYVKNFNVKFALIKQVIYNIIEPRNNLDTIKFLTPN